MVFLYPEFILVVVAWTQAFLTVEYRKARLGNKSSKNFHIFVL